MKNGDFTKRKFLDFPVERQHKKCAEVLRVAYEKLASGDSIEEEINVYQDLVEWMGYPKHSMRTHKEISDSYHKHARLALLKHKEHNLLPLVRQGDKGSAEKSWDLSIYLDHIRSAHNVGSILRTVEAFSLGDVYFSDNTPFCSNKQVQDTAMGVEQWVKCFANIKLENLSRPFIAMETSACAVSLFDFLFPDKFTLVIGNEEYGCSENTLQLADIIIEIPLRGRKNSLNVANAFAIAAGEISRQKNHHPLKDEKCSRPIGHHSLDFLRN